MVKVIVEFVDPTSDDIQNVVASVKNEIMYSSRGLSMSVTRRVIEAKLIDVKPAEQG